MGFSKFQLILLFLGLIILVSGQEAFSLRSGVKHIQFGPIGGAVSKGKSKFEKIGNAIGKAKEAADRAKAVERAKCYSDCKHATQRTADRSKYIRLCYTCRKELNL